MGDYIGIYKLEYPKKKGKLPLDSNREEIRVFSDRIGTCGSAGALAGQWLAGYALTDWPESRKVRARYLEYTGQKHKFDYDLNIKTKKGLEVYLGDKADDCTWVVANQQRLARIDLNKIKCRHLNSLLAIWLMAVDMYQVQMHVTLTSDVQEAVLESSKQLARVGAAWGDKCMDYARAMQIGNSSGYVTIG